MQGNGNQSGAEDRSAGFNVLVFVLDVWATSLQVFLHGRFGERFFGVQAAAVLLLIPIYMLAWPRDALWPMAIYLPLYLLVCGLARIDMVWRRMRGERPIHSRYNGRPIFMLRLPQSWELRFKAIIEPAVLFGVGVLMRSDNRPLAYYLMIGAICLFVQTQLAVIWMRMRATDMHDSVIEQQELAERFRGMRGDDF